MLADAQPLVWTTHSLRSSASFSAQPPAATSSLHSKTLCAHLLPIPYGIDIHIRPDRSPPNNPTPHILQYGTSKTSPTRKESPRIATQLRRQASRHARLSSPIGPPRTSVLATVSSLDHKIAKHILSRYPASPPLQTRHRRPPRDPPLPALHRPSHPQAPLCAPRMPPPSRRSSQLFTRRSRPATNSH